LAGRCATLTSVARAHSNLETEIKLRIEKPAAVRRQLARLGFSVAKRRVLESNTVFDTPAGELRAARKLLRLRQAGPLHILTFKGPAAAGPYKSREELEATFTEAASLGRILGRLGYAPAFRYEKCRTEYAGKNQAGVAMLDETPVGDFLELEGPPRWIDRTARALGFSPADYITASYGGLYLAHCASKGVQPANMVFSHRGAARK
jgi:adenylate cyclase class 2